MSKQREAKAAVVEEVKSKLSQSMAFVLADYRGLNVAEITQLRRQLREAGAELKVVKNTLTRIATRDLGLQGLDPYLEGPTAIVFTYGDPVAPAKVLTGFAKTKERFQLKAGILQGKVITPAEIKTLAELPSKEELVAKVMGGLKGPLYGLVNVLSGPIRNLVYVLEAVRREKEAS